MPMNSSGVATYWPAGSGSAASVREHPWETTPLGPIASWPAALRTAVDIMLRLPIPAALRWGADEVVLFNDAFAFVAGNRAARMLGRSLREWRASALWNTGAGATEIPLHDDADNVAGVLTLVGTDAFPGDDSEHMRSLETSYTMLEANLVERATELARANESLAANIAERSQAEEERKALQRQLAAAEEAERGRLSRELHDQLGQHLTAIALGLHEVASLVRPNSAARERLNALQDLTSLLTRDARYLAIELRPPELDDVGLESAMASYVYQWSQRYGIAAELQSTGVVRFQYPGDVATTMYRILQEALTNVAKHARAKQVSVIVEQTEADLRLIVEDDGAGFDVDTSIRRATSEHRMGLVGMRERASLVGGTLTLESSPGRGSTLFVRIPVG